MPNGRRIFTDGSKPGDNSQLRTDVDINLGPPPGRILRQLDTNNEGMTTSDTDFSPAFAEEFPTPHISLRRMPTRIALNALGGSADHLEIPAFSVGDPGVYGR